MRVAALAGGVGGAKLAHGLQAVLEPGELSVVINTGDDLELFGLDVAPDLDTVLYTLAGVANPDTGWGIAGDTWTALGMLGRYGEPTWFRIGDADLATHVRRTALLRSGMSRTDAAADMARALGVPSRLLPMADEPVRTRLETDAGLLDFQTYFVARGQRDEVRGVVLEGIGDARPTPVVLEALREADLIVFAPSNPVVSIGPILAVPGVRDAVERARVPRVAVSPIVAGKALRGPADRMLKSLGHEPTALGVARLYAGLVDTFVLDEADAALTGEIESLGMRAISVPAVMRTEEDRAELATRIIALGNCRGRSAGGRGILGGPTRHVAAARERYGAVRDHAGQREQHERERRVERGEHGHVLAQRREDGLDKLHHEERQAEPEHAPRQPAKEDENDDDHGNEVEDPAQVHVRGEAVGGGEEPQAREQDLKEDACEIQAGDPYQGEA